MVRLAKKETTEKKIVSKSVVEKVEKTKNKLQNAMSKKQKKVLSKNFIRLPEVEDIGKEKTPKSLVSKAFQPKVKLNKKKSNGIEKNDVSKPVIQETNKTNKKTNVTSNKQQKLPTKVVAPVTKAEKEKKSQVATGKTSTSSASNGSQSKSLSNKKMVKTNGVEKKDVLKGVATKIEKTKNKSSNVLNKKQEMLAKNIASSISKGPQLKSQSKKQMGEAKNVEKKDISKPVIKKIEIIENKITNIGKKKQKKSAPKNAASVPKADKVATEEILTSCTSEESQSDSLLNKKMLLKCVQALLKVSSSAEEQKKNLFQDEASKIHLQIVSIKVPKVPLHQHRITLPNSLVTSTDDVALFVADLNRGRKRPVKDSIDHAQDFLKAQGVERPIAVYSINQVKTEFREFELRRKLVHSHDFFLVDGRIAGHMSHLLGKQFRLKRKCPVPIHFDKSVKEEINRALHKTTLQIHAVGNSSTVEIGHTAMSPKQIIQNILAVADDLAKHFPGGWENICALRIKTPLSLSIPIYMSLKNKNDVPVPVIEPKRPKNYKEVEGELSTYKSNVKVLVAPDGTCMVLKKENEKETNESEAKKNKKASANKLDEEDDCMSEDSNEDDESLDIDSDDLDDSDQVENEGDDDEDDDDEDEDEDEDDDEEDDEDDEDDDDEDDESDQSIDMDSDDSDE